jgi:hypothetical protein
MKIVVTSWPLSVSKEESFKICQKNKILIDNIIKYSKELKEQNIETFDIIDNIIITEKGYFGAFFEEDLKKC